jgi:hypothetical protein
VRVRGREAPLPPCPVSVSPDGGWHFRPCGRPATRGRWCGVHDPNRPDKVKHREEAKERFRRSCAPAPLPPEVVAVLRGVNVLNDLDAYAPLMVAVKAWVAAGRPGLPPTKTEKEK